MIRSREKHKACSSSPRIATFLYTRRYFFVEASAAHGLVRYNLALRYARLALDTNLQSFGLQLAVTACWIELSIRRLGLKPAHVPIGSSEASVSWSLRVAVSMSNVRSE